MFSRIRSLTGFLCISLFLLNVVAVEPIRIRRAAESSQATTPATQQASKNAKEIALQNCYNYGQFREANQTKDISTTFYEIIKDDCSYPYHKGSTYARPKEYPHMVAIGYGKDFENVDWQCAGSLISDKFVLSLANCSESLALALGPAKWAVMGGAFTRFDADGVRPAVYEIVKRHVHPNYDPKSRLHDIALFELNSTVTMSPYLRPACLYTPNSIPNGTKATVTGWGATRPSKLKTLNLMKADGLVVEDKICETVTSNREKFGNFTYDSKTMTCSGKLLQNAGSCLSSTADYGSPLQIPVDKEPCMYNVVGVTLIRPTCESFFDPKYPTEFDKTIGDEGVYVKVSHYLDWIQKIVWP